MRMRSEGYILGLCVSVSTLISALRTTKRKVSDTNSFLHHTYCSCFGRVLVLNVLLCTLLSSGRTFTALSFLRRFQIFSTNVYVPELLLVM